MWQRRDNLHGASIRATCVKYPILTQEFSYDTDGKITSGKGFMMDLLKMLENNVNMTATLGFSIDGQFGAKTKNGSFNGMVGMLTRNETDVVVTSLTYTRERNHVIDYTKPIFPKDSVTLYAPLGKGEGLNYSAFVNTFPINVWILIAASFLILSIAFYIISISEINHFHEDTDSESFGLLNSMALSVILAIQLSYNAVVKSISARIMYLSGSFMAYVLFSYYEAVLTAELTTVGAKFNIRNFQDVMKYEYNVIVRHSSSNHEILRSAEEGTAMHNVYYNNMHDNPDQFVTSNEEGVKKIFSQEKTLFFGPEIAMLGVAHRLKKLRFEMKIEIKYFIQSNLISHFCYYHRIDEQFNSQTGWGIQANSEYAELLNHWLHKFDESGARDRIWRNWTYQATEEFGVEDAIVLGYNELTFVFLWIMGGVCISLIFFLGETILHKVRPKTMELQLFNRM